MITNCLPIVDEISKNKRVCPLPDSWNELYELLPEKSSNGDDRNPGLPLIRGAWGISSNSEKRYRLIEHIQWAKDHNALNEVYDFLISLPEEKWFHE
jgi:hypothetical protein